MFYIAKCKRCNYLVTAKDVSLLKARLGSHLERSHGYVEEWWQDVSLEDYEEVAVIMRVRDNAVIEQLEKAMQSKRFWQTYRNLSKSAIGIVT